MHPGSGVRPSVASTAGTPHCRVMWPARMAVKVAGMCCATRMGILAPGAMSLRTRNKACGPPVELPMAMICGGNVGAGRNDNRLGCPDADGRGVPAGTTLGVTAADLPELPDFLQQLPMKGGGSQQLARGRRFEDIVGGSFRKRIKRYFSVPLGVGRGHHDFDIGYCLDQQRDCCEPVHNRHLDVKHYDIDGSP